MPRRRRRRGVLGFLEDFNDGYKLTNQIAGSIAMARAAHTSPETIESPGNYEKGMGLDGAPNQAQMLQEQDAAFGAEGTKSTADALNSNTADMTQANPAAAVKTSYRMGGKTQDVPFTEDQTWEARTRAMGDVSMRYGNPVQAAQFMGLIPRHREDADQEQIHKILAGDRPPGLERITVGNPQPMPAPLGPQTANADGGAPPGPVTPATSPAANPTDQAPAPRKQGSYIDQVGPRVVEAYLRQGKIAEAKAWRSFAESERGQAYANDYAKAQHLVATGDFESAAPVLENLYNRGYPDGRLSKLKSLGDGNFQVDMFDQASGKLVGSKTMPAANLGKLAIGALSPTKLVEFTVQQQAKRDGEAATQDRQLKLEQLRQQGQDSRDDRRDERLGMRLDAQGQQLDRRLAAQSERGGLTQAQMRTNAEIDAARDAVLGLSPQEIMRRTAKATNTGRANPDFDPALARQAALANRRKIGDDEMFDGGRGQQSDTFSGKPLADMTDGQLQQFSRQAGPEGKQKLDAELTRRAFMGDQAMQGHQLGEMTPKGYKVFDPQGRHVGYYRR